jgi:deazaflavin-dependent oxidoreductase (nitroreductase family)
MNTDLKEAYDRGGVVDITTTGARTDQPRRIEINFIILDDRYYITGQPGRKRDWLANMNANPEFTIHLKRGQSVDVIARASEISDEEERAKVLYRILIETWENPVSKADHILPRWVEGAPLVEFVAD